MKVVTHHINCRGELAPIEIKINWANTVTNGRGAVVITLQQGNGERMSGFAVVAEAALKPSHVQTKSSIENIWRRQAAVVFID